MRLFSTCGWASRRRWISLGESFLLRGVMMEGAGGDGNTDEFWLDSDYGYGEK